MTKANTSVVAKLSVAFVAVAMLLTMVAPAKAATIEELQAMIAQLTAQLSSLSGSSTTTGYNFTRSITVGSQGADVTALQNYLISAGYPIAAGATGYFGAQSAAALAKWQAAHGISPAVGYFGPVSMAKYKSMTSTTSTGSTGSTSVTGGAGSANVTSTSADVEDEVDAGTAEKILGFKIEASDSDLKITNVKLTFTKESSSASTYLNRYFSSFDIVMDGETVATVDADSFTRDSAGVYSKSIALSNAIVRQDDKNTFYVVGHAVEAIDTANVDSDWSVDASNIRYVDGTGAILTDSTNITANSDININKLSSSGDVKVKFSLGSANPDTGTVLVSDDVSGDKITLLEFKVKAEGTDIAFDQVKFTIATSGATLTQMVSEFILMKGSTVIDTLDAADVGVATLATTTFDLDDQLMIDEDATVTYKLVAKMNKLNTTSFNAGDSLTATLVSINAEDKNGDLIVASRYSGSAVGNTQSVRGDGVNLALVSLSATDAQKTESNSTKEYAKFTLVFKVTADGDDFYVGDYATAVLGHLVDGNGAVSSLSSSTAISSTATKSGGAFLINDGETETFTYTVETGTSTGTFKFIADTFVFGTTSTATTTSSQTFTPTSDWTSAAVILN